MSGAIRAIFVGGLSAGLLDIIFAIVFYGPVTYGLTPMQVLQSVAAGWFGRDVSRAGGWPTALMGLGTHFMIATIMATVFVVAATRIKALTADAVLWGLVYGLMLYVAMNYVVVPLSAAHSSGSFPTNFVEVIERLSAAFSKVRPSDPFDLAGVVLTHTVFVGLPIALAARRFLSSP